MLVGATQSIEAMNSSSQSVMGLTWTSSNTVVVTLSTDDPPIIIAVAPGNATITTQSHANPIRLSEAPKSDHFLRQNRSTFALLVRMDGELKPDRLRRSNVGFLE